MYSAPQAAGAKAGRPPKARRRAADPTSAAALQRALAHPDPAPPTLALPSTTMPWRAYLPVIGPVMHALDAAADALAGFFTLRKPQTTATANYTAVDADADEAGGAAHGPAAAAAQPQQERQQRNDESTPSARGARRTIGSQRATAPMRRTALMSTVPPAQRSRRR